MRDIPPQFIILEGIDGSGKTELAESIVLSLRALGHKADYTRAPGGTPVGQRIREMVVDDPTLIRDPYTRQLLFIADHRELFTQVVLPRLDAGVTVVLDRFIDSTMAYACGALGLDKEFVATVCSLVFPADTPFVTPKVLWLKVPVPIALERLGKRALDGSDHMYMDKLQKIQDYYEGSYAYSQANPASARWTQIDAGCRRDVVLKQAMAAVRA